VSNIESGATLRDSASVEPVGTGHYAVALSEDFTVLGRPHGGYLQCVLASAALAAASEAGSSHLHAVALSTNFAGGCEPGLAQLHTAIRRLGRGASFVHVTLSQHGGVAVESLVTLATLHDEPARYSDAVAPLVAPLDQCVRWSGPDQLNITRALDLRLDPASDGWSTGQLSTRGEVLAWMRLGDGNSTWDPWSMLFASDALPPATFPLGSSGWVPTLQLTTYARRIPVGEWLRARQWCVVIAGDMVDERCELFDERGELVGSSSQLAMVRFPKER